MPDLSSSLDPVEIAVAPVPISSSVDTPALNWSMPQPFKHRSWAKDRQRVHDAIRETEVSPGRRRRLAACGAHVWVLQSKADTDRYKIVVGSCRDKFCVPCGRARAHLIRSNLHAHIEGLTLRMLTLTLVHRDAPLADQIDRLVAAFRRLRSRPFWKERVRGGIAFMEVVHSERTGCWHPHWHVLLDSDYLPQADLAAAWLDATGDSRIVDIRLVRDPRVVADYVTKYVTKPIPAAVYRTRHLLQEAVQALAGRRMLVAFGDWRSFRLLDAPGAGEWTLYAHEGKLVDRAAAGCARSQALVDAITLYYHTDADADVFLPSHLFARSPPAAALDAQLRLW